MARLLASKMSELQLPGHVIAAIWQRMCTRHGLKVSAAGQNQSDMKIIMKIIINIQYQINGAQLDNDVCTLGQKLWWLPKKPKCFLDRPDGSENTRLKNKLVHAPVETRGPGVLVQQILEFLETWIFNKPDDNKWKNQICEPNLGHFQNVFFLQKFRLFRPKDC